MRARPAACRARPALARAPSARVAAALAAAVACFPLLASCTAPPAGTSGNAIPGLDDLVRPGETVLFTRRFPVAPAPAGTEAPWALAAVVRLGDGHEEMRLGEPRGKGYAQVFASRPGDEFRNLVVEDINADGRPEVVGRWAGGQLEVVEVLGRGADGAWKALLQNAGQVIEERRRADRTIAFWITSRTYEEEPGLPPVYETRVWRWDGSAFSEDTR